MVDTLKSIKITRAVIWHFWPMILIYIWFFGSNHQVTTYFDQKNQHFEFLSFFSTTSIRTWILANLTPLPPPHGAPPSPTHPTTLLYVFASQWVQKMCLFIKNRLAKKNLKLTGHHQLGLILGPFWRAFKWWTTHRTTLGSPPRVFSCSTTPTPCPKPRHRRSEA